MWTARGARQSHGSRLASRGGIVDNRAHPGGEPKAPSTIRGRPTPGARGDHRVPNMPVNLPPQLQPLKGTVRDALLAAAFTRVDGFIVSYMKSGRTWFRFILANYFNEVFRLGVQVDFHSIFAIIPNYLLNTRQGWGAYRFADRPQVPFLVVSHLPYRRLLFGTRDILFVLRDPRDVMVSAYFHKTRHAGLFNGDMDTFLRDPDHGIANYIRYFNSWAGPLGRHRHLVVAYERLSTDTAAVLEEVLAFLDLEVDRKALAEAMNASSFRAMRSIEVQSGHPVHQYDRTDIESLHVRRGKVGGFRDYLDDAQIAYIDQACASRLDGSAKHLLAGAGIALG